LTWDAGAAVEVRGRQRSWDQLRDDSTDDPVANMATDEATKLDARRDYRIEIIAEKVELIE
jgi:hypothetical protein